MKQRVWLLPLMLYVLLAAPDSRFGLWQACFADRSLHRVRFQRTLIKLALDMCMQFSFKIKGEAKSGCTERAGMLHRWGNESWTDSGLSGHWESRAGLLTEIRISQEPEWPGGKSQACDTSIEMGMDKTRFVCSDCISLMLWNYL